MTPKISRLTISSFFLLLCFVSSSSIKAQVDTLSVYKNINDTQWDLEDVLTIALANNPDLRRATLSVEDAERLVFIAYSNLVPDISTSMNYTRNVEIPVNFIPESVFDPNGDPNKLVPIAFGTDNNWQGGFTIEQNIFQGPALVGVSTGYCFSSGTN
jgi:outer membrane protein TolC